MLKAVQQGASDEICNIYFFETYENCGSFLVEKKALSGFMLWSRIIIV